MKIVPEILASGSKGNMIIYDKIIVDAGISYRRSKQFIKDCKYLFLTHEHSDHFLLTTMLKISIYRPDIKIVAPFYLKELLERGNIKNVMYIIPGEIYTLGNIKFQSYELKHNVLNVAYSFEVAYDDVIIKIFHATDTYDLEGIEAKGYDIYAIEMNHDEATIERDIMKAHIKGEYTYKVESSMNHMSIQRAEKWLEKNFDYEKSTLYPLHISSSYLEGGE